MLHSKNIKHHGFGLFGRTIFLFVKVGKTWGGSAFCFPLFIHRRAKQTVKNNLKLKTIEVGHCSIYSCSWNAILCIYNICDNMCIYIYISDARKQAPALPCRAMAQRDLQADVRRPRSCLVNG